jgi:DNA-binding NarL/FixJ family response regulator
MPVMNGLEAARELQRLLPKVPILMFTTFCHVYIERQALASGVTAVKSKSESIESLFGSIQNLLQTS